MTTVSRALVALALLLPAAARADEVRHVPPGEAEAGRPVELVADAPATVPTLTAHVRHAGDTGYDAIELVRRDGRWVAVVPAADVAVPGLEYYLDAGGVPVFASARWPHRIEVHAPPDVERRGRDVVRAAGHRSRIHTMAEWVDYGTRTVDGMALPDRYYRIDADFAYRLWAYPLEELRIGYTRLIGDTPAMTCPGAAPCTAQVGFKVGGWFELGLAPIEGVRLDARAMMMATAEGFKIGGRAEARLGDREASHVALGVEYLADVGTAGYFRLGWGTVPGLPMAATVEVTNLPASDRDPGVRLFYDIGRALGRGVTVALRVGYATRVSSVAGISGGAGMSVDF